jgi:hypothetical protein
LKKNLKFEVEEYKRIRTSLQLLAQKLPSFLLLNKKNSVFRQNHRFCPLFFLLVASGRLAAPKRGLKEVALTEKTLQQQPETRGGQKHCNDAREASDSASVVVFFFFFFFFAVNPSFPYKRGNLPHAVTMYRAPVTAPLYTNGVTPFRLRRISLVTIFPTGFTPPLTPGQFLHSS